ncbi:MAG: DUF3817 domain-containing protein [Bacteroidia bacterium]|nr:DUF3817 domain-containing protein [Bacteroidia bacterium]NNF29997.1 DUF3817 domain-containing protein [Flavobacteriaceae bacterium]MBT8276023.1 DUF3817 domain-containing protein [Bacteroidia bacterium]NNJ83201.1 DUF3817 domain-containing protein [Flavobacteriaceae bacterium]NNK53702.1 DUF3817 domain-containing protein [Flavobacteriaceae bacterium]
MSVLNISIKSFKIISTLEAISFLVLLGIAMPLKYIWDMPEYVSAVGMAHGILFMMYLVGAWYMKEKLNWTWRVLCISFACAVLPFGPFYVERKYLR